MGRLFLSHLRELLSGAGTVINVAPRRDYVMPDTMGFARDRRMLVGDVNKIGKDIQKAIKKRG